MSKRPKQIYATLRVEKILALDVGSKYIGAALGTERSRSAYPYAICAWQGKEDILTEFLQRIFKEECIIKIVMGYVPDQHNLRASNAIATVEHIVRALTDVQIVYVDEHVSTQEAENRLAILDMDPRELRKTRKDDIAAQIILERYFSLDGGAA